MTSGGEADKPKDNGPPCRLCVHTCTLTHSVLHTQAEAPTPPWGKLDVELTSKGFPAATKPDVKDELAQQRRGLGKSVGRWRKAAFSIQPSTKAHGRESNRNFCSQKFPRGWLTPWLNSS